MFKLRPTKVTRGNLDNGNRRVLKGIGGYSSKGERNWPTEREHEISGLYLSNPD